MQSTFKYFTEQMTIFIPYDQNNLCWKQYIPYIQYKPYIQNRKLQSIYSTLLNIIMSHFMRYCTY